MNTTRSQRKLVGVLVFASLALGIACNKTPAGPSPIVDVIPPPPPGLSYLTVPTGDVRLKDSAGNDTSMWIRIMDVLPVPGSMIYLGFSGSCGFNSQFCPQYRIWSCIDEGKQADGLLVYFSENKGEFKNFAGPGGTTGNGCETIDQMIVPGSWTRSFPRVNNCCYWLEFVRTQVEFPGGIQVQRRGTASFYVGYRTSTGV